MSSILEKFKAIGTDLRNNGKCDISINLDDNIVQGSRGVITFVPGQTVSGKVTLLLHSEKEIETVDIELEGQCITKFCSAKSGTVSETIPLFSISQTLLKGPFKMQPTTKSWLFSFKLPESSNFYRHRYNQEDTIFNHGPQSLPPSLDKGSAGMRFEAIVTYNLMARINNPSSLFGGFKQSVLPIVVLNVSQEPPPRPSTRQIPITSQKYKSDLLRSQQLTMKQKISYIFTRDPALKTPSITLGATAYIPSKASAWQYLPLSVSFQYQRIDRTDPPHPTLILERVILQLKEFTSISAKTEYQIDSSILSTQRYLFGKKIRLDNTIFLISNHPALVEDPKAIVPVRLVDMVAEDCRLVLTRLVPSFTTYTINHYYKLSMACVVLHPETGHQFTLEAERRFQMLPSTRDDMNANNSSQRFAGEGTPQQMNIASPDVGYEGFGGEELPAYNDAPISKRETQW